VLRSYQPHQEQFLKLKALLADLRSKADDSAKFAISKRGPMLRVGSRGPDVAVLKRRFGIASELGAEDVFDQPLADAIKTFQKSVSLQGDGIIGPATRAVLSRDASDKIAAVIANMEEWRWMPRSLGATHILVNVPAFSIALTQDDRTVFEDRVVVGTPNLQTPIFSKNMTTLVLRPQWYLPNSIKLTKLLSGRSLESQGYVIKRNGRTVSSSQVNWANANLSAYTVYQPSGSDNALGLVKFLFPNKHSVYLHDTPSKSLFNHSVRLFSHGCVRVRNPLVLAQDILDIDRGDAAPNVKQLAHKGPQTNHITLDTPIPVHIGYFTVWVDDSGEPHFYKDYYGHQQRITLALAGKWDQIDVGKDHLAAVDTSRLRNISIGRESKSATADDFGAPMGLSNTFGTARSGGSVGDMIQRALGH
jgi:murein L,D-transpeptidase YcbB/YkuD